MEVVNSKQLLENYAEEIKNLSDNNKAFVQYYLDCCIEIPVEILNLLREHELEAEYQEATKKLVIEAAEPIWFEMFFYAIENKSKYSVLTWLNLILDCFSLKIAPEEVFKCVRESDSVHHLSIIKEQYSSDNEELKEVMSSLLGMKNILDVMQREKTENSDLYKTLEENNRSLHEKLIFSEKEIETVKRRASTLEMVYNDAQLTNEKLKSEIVELQSENSKLKLAEQNSDELEKLKKEKEQLKEENILLKNKSSEIPQDELVRIIQKGFKEQKDLLSDFFDNFHVDSIGPGQTVPKADANITVSEPSVGTDDTSTDNVLETPSKADEEISVTVTQDSETTSEETLNLSETVAQAEPVIVFGTVNEKKASFIRKTIEHHKRNRMMKQFQKLDSAKKQKETIVRCLVDRKFEFDAVRYIKKALEENVCSLEFAYGLAIDSAIDEKVFEMLLERSAATEV